MKINNSIFSVFIILILTSLTLNTYGEGFRGRVISKDYSEVSLIDMKLVHYDGDWIKETFGELPLKEENGNVIFIPFRNIDKIVPLKRNPNSGLVYDSFRVTLSSGKSIEGKWIKDYTLVKGRDSDGISHVIKLKNVKEILLYHKN